MDESHDAELQSRAKAIEESRKKSARGSPDGRKFWPGASTAADEKGVKLANDALLKALGGEMKKAVVI